MSDNRYPALIAPKPDCVPGTLWLYRNVPFISGCQGSVKGFLLFLSGVHQDVHRFRFGF